MISFEGLYISDKDRAVALFLTWIEEFLKGYDASVIMDDRTVLLFLASLRKERDNFPAVNGYDNASPFKKAANIYVWLHVYKSMFISDPAPDIFGPEMARHENALATLLGFSIVQNCLHGATLYKDGVDEDTLTNPISVSKHFFFDLVECSRDLKPANHFKVFSLLFEALAYQANPDAPYDPAF